MGDPRERATTRRDLPPMTHYAKATAVVLLVVALALMLAAVRGVALLVFIAFLLAAGLDPLVSALERRGVRRGLAVAVVFGAGLLGFTLFAVLALTPAIAQFAQFVSHLPDTLQSLGQRLGNRSSRVGTWLASPEVKAQIQSLLDKVPDLLASSVGAVFGALSAVVGAIFAGLTVTALAVYFTLALPRIKAFATGALEHPQRSAVMLEALSRVGGYVTGQLAVCAIHGIVSYAFFLIVGLPYAALLAVVVAVLDAVPQIGALLGCLVALVVAIPVGLGVAIAVVVYFLVYQQLENYVLAPRIFSKAVELSPLAVFLAVLVGGSLGGLVGAVAALPVAAATKVVFRYAFRERLARIDANGATAAGEDHPDGPGDAGDSGSGGAGGGQEPPTRAARSA